MAGELQDSSLYDDYIQKQLEIYLRAFRGAENTVLAPHKLVVQGVRGYLIAWKYPYRLSNIFATFGQNISRIVPAICYGSDQLHTTVTDYLVTPSTEIDSDILEQLCQVVNLSEHKIRSSRNIFSRWVFGKDTVIIPAFADDFFIESAFVIQTAGKEIGLDLRLPWGSHITVARFTEKVVDQEKIRQLQELLSFSPAGEFILNTLIVGSFELTQNSFRLDVFKTYCF
jgi:hypothetical protein